MPFTDWDVYQSDPGLDVRLDLLSPLAGIGSLYVARSGVAGTDHAVNLALGAAAGVGPFTRGVLRALFRVTTAATASPHALGLFCQASQRDLTGGVGACYAALLLTTGTSGQVDSFGLYQFGSGLAEPTTPLAAETGLGIPAGTVVALELEWETIEGAGVLLSGRRGSAANFSDLVQRWQTMETSGALTTSLAEGLCFWIKGSGDYVVRADDTTVAELQ